ncbi:MAG: transposase, partial [Chloroflexia bacterium]|nr:transposase [Chloroflexia bacterium]
MYEWCIEARRKRGAKRRDLDVTTCFVPLLRWMISMWGDSLQIALTLDATTLSSRFAILVVSVVYRGNAIPVAWTIVPATEKRAWRRDWLRMLRLLRPGIPSDWTVLVLRDRGRYAGWLFRPIIRLGWHPFMRIKAGSTFRPPGKAKWRTLRTLV